MYRIVACDLDETLLCSDGTISEENKKAIQRAKDEFGVKFVIASGRSLQGAEKFLKELNLWEEENQYAITVNGAILTKIKEQEVLAKETLNKEIVERLLDFAKEHNVCTQVFALDFMRVYYPNERELDRIKGFGSKYEVCETIEERDYLNHVAVAKVLFEDEEMEHLYALYEQMPIDLKEQLAISYSSGRYMECNVKGIHKAVGLKRLSEYLQIPMAQIMAIGDQDNDKEMLAIAGLGVAVQNASDPIKKIADAITNADHDHGAVAEAIRTYIFQE